MKKPLCSTKIEKIVEFWILHESWSEVQNKVSFIGVYFNFFVMSLHSLYSDEICVFYKVIYRGR
jgi:hypothetical protein